MLGNSNISGILEIKSYYELLETIDNEGYIIIERYLNSHLLSAAKDEYLACMRSAALHSHSEAFNPNDLEKGPWRKQSVGSRSGSGETYSQVLQTTYFFPCDARFPALQSIFSAMIHLRNNITGMPPEYGNQLDRDKFWNACRVHHYPQGGGHMAAHRDTLFPSLLGEFRIPFIQLMVTLSSRGTDFTTGGGYVLDRNGKKVFFETADNAGSLILFDGATVHGVEDIDPSNLLDFSSPKGRLALFVNLYKNKHID